MTLVIQVKVILNYNRWDRRILKNLNSLLIGLKKAVFVVVVFSSFYYILHDFSIDTLWIYLFFDWTLIYLLKTIS